MPFENHRNPRKEAVGVSGDLPAPPAGRVLMGSAVTDSQVVLFAVTLLVVLAGTELSAQQQKIDVGGHRLSITCAGRGTPTVILENGAAAPPSSVTWERVAPRIAEYSRVCYYDRAGYGNSEPGPKPRTSQQIVHELRTLLRKARISPPYILVGHSFGGLSVRLFANQFPNDVAGLVLVESAHEDMKVLFTKVRQEQRLPDTAAFPPAEELKAAMQGYPWVKAAVDEWTALDESLSQVRSSRNTLEQKPLVVLARGKAGRLPGVPSDKMQPFDEVWRGLQVRLAKLSREGQLTIVKGSGHDIPREQPEAIVNAVRQVFETFRGR